MCSHRRKMLYIKKKKSSKYHKSGSCHRNQSQIQHHGELKEIRKFCSICLLRIHIKGQEQIKNVHPSFKHCDKKYSTFRMTKPCYETDSSCTMSVNLDKRANDFLVHISPQRGKIGNFGFNYSLNEQKLSFLNDQL